MGGDTFQVVATRRGVQKHFYIHTYIQGFLKESLTKLVSIGFRLYQRIFEFCKKGNSQNDPLQSNTLKSVPTLSQKTFFPVLCVNQGMGRPCSPRELVVSTFPFFKSVLLLLLLLLLHCTPNDVSGRFETTGAFPSMFFTCPNFFQKIFLPSLPENR